MRRSKLKLKRRRYACSIPIIAKLMKHSPLNARQSLIRAAVNSINFSWVCLRLQRNPTKMGQSKGRIQMTFEEMEKTMAFILEQQAQATVKQAKADVRIDRLERVVTLAVRNVQRER